MIDDEFSPPESLPATSPSPTPAKPSAAKPSAGRGVSHRQPCPVCPTDSLLAELWAACLGHCEEWQLQVIPQHAMGLPTNFHAHPIASLITKLRVTFKNVVPVRYPPMPLNLDNVSMSILDLWELQPVTTQNQIQCLTALSHRLAALPATSCS